MFCTVSEKPFDSVWGMDTELYEHETEAIKDVDAELIEEKKQGALEEQKKRGEILRGYELWLFNNGLLSRIEAWWSESYLKEKDLKVKTE